MTGETDLQLMLASLRATRRPGEFVFVSLPGEVPAGLAVAASICEDEGLTVVIARAEADAAGLSYDFVAAWISLEVHSALEAVGLTAAFSTALGDAGVSCNVLAGYFHDHILVPIADADRALAVLARLAD
jgi:hypothetical protein